MAVWSTIAALGTDGAPRTAVRPATLKITAWQIDTKVTCTVPGGCGFEEVRAPFEDSGTDQLEGPERVVDGPICEPFALLACVGVVQTQALEGAPQRVKQAN